MSVVGTYTRQEIYSQPEVWASALQYLVGHAHELAQFWRTGQFETVLFTGCGSTYYLSLAAAAFMQDTSQIYARALPASEVWLSPRTGYPVNKSTMLVAVSRSGETTETLRAVERFREMSQGAVLTLSCYADRPLASAGDINLVFDMAQEQSIAQTRAFSVLYLAAIGLVSVWNELAHALDTLQRLPAVGHRLLERYTDLAQQYGQNMDLEATYYLGSSLRYGLAGELSLKMKEMSLSISEAFHFLEFRHGPQSMANAQALVVGLLSDTNREQEQAVLNDMQQLGAHTLSIGETNTDVAFESGLPEALRNVLYLPIGQLMAFERAIVKGRNPDMPNNLSAVVRLDKSHSE